MQGMVQQTAGPMYTLLCTSNCIHITMLKLDIGVLSLQKKSATPGDYHGTSGKVPHLPVRNATDTPCTHAQCSHVLCCQFI